MVRRPGPLLAIAILVGGLAGCLPRAEPEAACIPYTPPHPVALVWSEDIDTEMASAYNFAPPRLEVMPDGRAIANATAVQVLSPTALSALMHRIQADLGTPSGGRTDVTVRRPDGQGWQAREDLSLWSGSGSPSYGTVFYQPPPLSTTPATSAPATAHGVLTVDTGLPPAWKDAIDTLNALTLQTLAAGKPYRSAEIRVLVSYDDNLYRQISGGQLVRGTGMHPWPAGIAHVPAYQPGGPSTYPIQQFSVSGPGVAAAQHAFVQYQRWPAVLQLYDDGIAGQHYGWYGLWRPLAPGEQEPAAMPLLCGGPRSSASES